MSALDGVIITLDDIVCANRKKGNRVVMYLACLVPVSISYLNSYLETTHRSYRIKEFDSLKIKIEIIKEN